MVRTEQAAEILDVKKSTLEAWRCRGGGPPFVKYGRAIRYRETDLQAFIESRLRTNTSGADENRRCVMELAITRNTAEPERHQDAGGDNAL